MPFYDTETIEQARRVDLLTYLQTCEPQELVHVSGNVYCTREHDSLRISNGKWCWFSQGFGGYSALDYLITEEVADRQVEQPVGNQGDGHDDLHILDAPQDAYRDVLDAVGAK